MLAELVAILDVDASFLRYNDHSIRAAVLAAEWPQRLDKPDPDPLDTVYFADADPIFAPAEHAKKAVVFRPGSASESYQCTISEAITESMLIRDLVNIWATLVGLREIGVDIAIDDFGTGYSGMSLLTSLPVGTLKIDRGFVLDLATSADDLAIVRAVIALARAPDIGVVAEGVETEGAARAPLNEGCSRAQGFLFCRPIPAETTERLLAEGSVAVQIQPTASSHHEEA
jgi:hypothetical protein